MILVDVNVLVHSYREDSPRHGEIRPWLEAQLSGEEPFGISDLVLAGFLRVVTNPGVFNPPTPLAEALAFTEALRTQENCIVCAPGPRHWEIFVRLCRESGARGNLVADAYHAALAIEWSCEWVTTDRDYSRFPGLRWTAPS